MSSIILKSLIAATVFVSGAPVFAAPADAPQKTSLKYDAKTNKYCMTEAPVTGSHISRITCQTSVQWSAQGLDMPKTVILAAK